MLRALEFTGIEFIRQAKALNDTSIGGPSGGKASGKRPAGNWSYPDQKKVMFCVCDGRASVLIDRRLL